MLPILIPIQAVNCDLLPDNFLYVSSLRWYADPSANLGHVPQFALLYYPKPALFVVTINCKYIVLNILCMFVSCALELSLFSLYLVKIFQEESPDNLAIAIGYQNIRILNLSRHRYRQLTCMRRVGEF